MNVRALRSSSTERNPRILEIPRKGEEGNLAWIRRAIAVGLFPSDPGWSLLLLVGGADRQSFRLRVAQSHVRHDLSPSAWSHIAFVAGDGPLDAKTPLREVSLAPSRGFGPRGFAPPRNGIQDAILGDYADAAAFPNIALVWVPVATDLIADAIERLTLQRNGIDVPALILPWLAYCWGVGIPSAPLGEGIGMPSAAILEAAFMSVGLDLTPGLESRSSCPEAIWQSLCWWHLLYENTVAEQRAMIGVFTAAHHLVPEGSS